MAKFILCALALVATKRPVETVGTLRASYKLEAAEQCYESITRVGRTWIEDELLWYRPTELEQCL